MTRPRRGPKRANGTRPRAASHQAVALRLLDFAHGATAVAFAIARGEDTGSTSVRGLQLVQFSRELEEAGRALIAEVAP